MADAEREKKCSDCGCALEAVKVIDHGHYNVATELEYAAIDAKPKFWSGIKAIGRVKAWLCPECSRMYFYAEPKNFGEGWRGAEVDPKCWTEIGAG